MSQIAKVAGGGQGTNGRAIGKLLGVTDDLEFNFDVDIAFGAMGVLFSGVFGATGVVAFRGGIDLGQQNPPTMITDPVDGSHSGLVVDAPGLYFHHVLTGTMYFALTGGTVAVTDIDVTVFAPRLGYYSLGHKASAA